MANKVLLETRRTDRLRAGWRVMVLLPNNETADGLISDVSSGGLRFTSPLEFKRGAKISIDILISSKQFVRTRILVVREMSRTSECKTYGAKFVDMGKLDRTLLDLGMDDLEPMNEAKSPPSPSGSRFRGFRELIAWFRGF